MNEDHDGGPVAEPARNPALNGSAVPSVTPITVVVPTRREAGNVRELHRRLAQQLADQDWSVVFVDDSDDATVDVLAELADADSRVTVIHRDQGAWVTGVSGAVLVGLRHAAAARAGALVVMSADLQHPVDVIMQLVEAVTETYADIAVASRYADGGSAPGSSRGRQLVSNTMRRLTDMTLQRASVVRDPLSGFFALRPEVIRDVVFHPQGPKVLLEILTRGRWSRVAEVGYAMGARHSGRSKVGVLQAARLTRQLTTLYRALPARHSDANIDPDRQLRVLVLTSEAPPVVSGISRSVAMLSEGLQGRGHHVDIVSRADFPRLSRREIRLSSFALFWPSFRKLLSQYDVVNVHGPVPMMSETFLLLFKSLSEGSRPGIVYTHHSDLAIPGLDRASAFYNRTTRNLAHVADAIVVTSEHYQDKLSELEGAPLHVIPWAVGVQGRAPERAARADGPLRALFVGQLRPYKGLSELLSAAAAAPEIDFTIVGDGPLRDKLESRIRRERLRNVRMTGRLSDEALWEAYAAADAIVLPSTTTAEAYGLVLIEGMAAGCVPIASDLPGVRNVAGPTGVLVPPQNAAALARALRDLAGDPDRLASLAASSLAAVETYDLSDMIDSYERVLRQVAGATTQRHSATVTPQAWADPQSFLAEVNETLGTSNASLTLVDPATGHGRVWRPKFHASIEKTPVAAYAAQRRQPLLIQGISSDPVLAKLLHRREVTSSIVIPLHTGSDRVAVLAASTDSDSIQLLDEKAMHAAMGLLATNPNIGSVGRPDSGDPRGGPSGTSGSTIRLVIDGRVLDRRYNGVGRVVYELLKVLTLRENLDIVLLTGGSVPAHFDLEALVRGGRLRVKQVDIPLFAPSHFWKVERTLRKLSADVALFPYHLASPIGPGVPRVSMIHDCIFESDPTTYFSRWSLPVYKSMTRAILHSSEVVTVSTSSAKEIERYYGVKVATEAIAHLGIDPAFAARAPEHSVRDELGLPDRFLLTVGARRPHKNLSVLMHALTMLDDDVHLVCVGWVDDRFADPVPSLIESLGVGNRVHHLPSVSDQTLAGLYREASAMVYPSQLEGFGLPMLEAMISGTPIVASSIPVLAEIAGDAAILVSPDVPALWAEAITTLLTDEAVRDDLVERARQRAGDFTWDRAADGVLSAVHRAAVRSRPGGRRRA